MCGHVGDGNFHCFLVIDPDNADDVRKAKAFGNRLGRWVLSRKCLKSRGILFIGERWLWAARARENRE